MPQPQTIADLVSGNIRAEMARSGKLQSELGESIGLGQQAVSARLGGTVRWTLVELVAVARCLGVLLSRLAPDSLIEAQP